MLFEVTNEVTGAIDQRREAVTFGAGLAGELVWVAQHLARIGAGFAGGLGLFFAFAALGGEFGRMQHARLRRRFAR